MAKKLENSISVFAPATVANLACGFDVMGLAIDSPGDEVRVGDAAVQGSDLQRLGCPAGHLANQRFDVGERLHLATHEHKV